MIESPDIPKGISDGLEGIIHDFPFFFIFVKAASSSVPIYKEITHFEQLCQTSALPHFEKAHPIMSDYPEAGISGGHHGLI
ncbi:MAG: hypothetical protein LBB80_05865 [Treponema sp.]|jgi:hypothetical protein|nr:hypothetical protein [Treponema sp.]